MIYNDIFSIFILCVDTQTELLQQGPPSWIVITHKPTLYTLRKHWKAWASVCDSTSFASLGFKHRNRACDSSFKALMGVRKRALAVEGTGHGRAGVSASWRRDGVASAEDHVASKWRYNSNADCLTCFKYGYVAYTYLLWYNVILWCTFFDLIARHINPTLFDLVTRPSSARFMECQGPAGVGFCKNCLFLFENFNGIYH